MPPQTRKKQRADVLDPNITLQSDNSLERRKARVSIPSAGANGHSRRRGRTERNKPDTYDIEGSEDEALVHPRKVYELGPISPRRPKRREILQSNTIEVATAPQPVLLPRPTYLANTLDQFRPHVLDHRHETASRKRKQTDTAHTAAKRQRTDTVSSRSQPGNGRGIAEEVAQQSSLNNDGKSSRDAMEQTNESDVEEDVENDEEKDAAPDHREDESANANPLEAQWAALRKVYKAHRHIGVNVEGGVAMTKNVIKLKDTQVKRIHTLCEDLTKLLADRKEQQSGGESQAESFPDDHADMLELRRKVRRLYKSTAQTDPERSNVKRAIDIYAHAIPDLVSLLQALVAYYTTLDTAAFPQSAQPITLPHLDSICSLINLILALCTGAARYARPPSDLKIVQPVRSGISVPLTRISTALHLHTTHQNHLLTTATLAAQADHQTQQTQQHLLTTQATHTAHVARRTAWLTLHATRLHAEGRPSSAAKAAHLAVPGSSHTGTDPGDRAFHSAAARALREDPAWPREASGALRDALRDFAGPRVLERVCLALCLPGEELHAYNVTQIVVRAALLRAFLVRAARTAGLEVEEWVRGIPVWTERALIEQPDEGGEVEG